MKTLVLGGARSGKSAVAESLLGGSAAGSAADYVATGARPSADDLDWAARVATHQARRPANWRTVETLDLIEVFTAPAPPALIECMSTWLAAVMDEIGFWDAAPAPPSAFGTASYAFTDAVPQAEELGARIDAVVAAFAQSTRPLVVVSSEVGLSVVPATESGRRYRDELGRLNIRLAAAADDVLFVVAGLPQRLK